MVMSNGKAIVVIAICFAAPIWVYLTMKKNTICRETFLEQQDIPYSAGWDAAEKIAVVVLVVICIALIIIGFTSAWILAIILPPVVSRLILEIRMRTLRKARDKNK